MNEALRERVTLVSGATGSLGSVVAERFAAAGSRLALTSRRMDELEQLASRLNLPAERCFILEGDVSDEEFVAKLVDAAVRQLGRLDILLNTVGVWTGGSLVHELAFEQWNRAMNLNLHTAFLLSRAVLPPMMELKWGRIVHVSARTAQSPRPNQAEYAVSKRGLIALTEAIAEEVRGSAITSNVILPSIIDTAPNRERYPDANYGAWVKPEHIAEMMYVLCGEESSSINGAKIEMYGSA